MNYKAISSVFVVLAVIFAAATGYLLVSPNTVTQTTTQISTQTTTQTTTQAITQTANSPFTVGVAFKSPIGAYLTNSSGWTLYLFTKDTPNNGASACYGACAKVWPPFYTSNLVVPPGVNASSFSTITRTDGSKQLAYNGYPLYYYTPDKKAGDTNGQGVGGVWFAYSLPTPNIPTSTTTTTSSYYST